MKENDDEVHLMFLDNLRWNQNQVTTEVVMDN